MTLPVDLRSDTITQPTAAMREAVAHANVGDDGYGEDPTINELENLYARLTGKESALFVPSGVMANQIALRVLTAPGDVVVTGRHHHIGSFEMGAAGRNSSVQFCFVDDDHGFLDVEEVVDIIDAERDHQPHVGLISLENSHMFAGGVPWNAEQIAAFAARLDGRTLYIDGARLFNAVVATGESAATLAAPASAVSSSLSKGLCAPVGSLLAGSAEVIDRARVERKRLGGAMRQAGFLAAAGIVALSTMVDRLADDHRRARRIADAIADRFPECEYDPASCRTNIVAFNHPDARQLVERLTEHGVLGATIAPRRARFVTHADLTDDDIDRACEVITSLG